MKVFKATLKTGEDQQHKRSEKEQGFRRNRSTIDAIFTIRQFVEKAIKYNKLAYTCLIALAKAFDRVRLSDIMKILKQLDIPGGHNLNNLRAKRRHRNTNTN